MPVDGFWRGRRVLVTGHTGFKGSWLTFWLRELGAVAQGYSLPPPTCPSLFEQLDLAADVPTITADVRDRAQLKEAVRAFGPEVVLHLAAQSLVLRSYAEPVETFATNVLGTVHLLEAVRSTPGVRSVVVVTSDKCYRDHPSEAGYREDDPLGGHDPYAASKACAELVTRAYDDSFFGRSAAQAPAIGLASARAGNVIGGGDWAEGRLVPDLVRGFEAGRSVAIRRPDAVRPWQHVLEPLSGYLLLARRLHEGDETARGAWNFGPRLEDARTVGWVADRVRELWSREARWHVDEGTHGHETHLLRVDWTKAQGRLGWRPRWGLDETLRRTVGWYRGQAANPGPEALREALRRDIAAHTAAAGDGGGAP